MAAKKTNTSGRKAARKKSGARGAKSAKKASGSSSRGGPSGKERQGRSRGGADGEISRLQGPSSPMEMLVTELRQIYSAETQLVRALPRLARKIGSDRLHEMLNLRVEQGEDLIADLETALDELEASPGRARNEAAEGLLRNMADQAERAPCGAAHDAMLLASVQKLEHYCIAAWGTARSIADLLGETRVVRVMQRVLDEGKGLDADLTELAEDEINPSLLDGEDEGGMRPSRDERSGRGQANA
jgi:ferritin-like metal-binding protein YciE